MLSNSTSPPPPPSTTPLNTQYLTDILKSRLNADHVEVVDQSGGCGASFHAIIVSTKFQGLSLLKCHRLVNECIKDEIHQMHAFSQKTYTPEQYQSTLRKQS
ncbi:hypothetical protein HMI54_012631 [Coelomomyces lativittatus]|nr:hypothetical protein HMI56_002788 [Coelomomyces lativittatus]KAJ1515248.1 hypothetical protein HMI54_012631 [Coelomomyces lativittatus]KAJ1517697.1 hypothetical protein HMI55_006287 [Coelomomyces lativittatus]